MKKKFIILAIFSFIVGAIAYSAASYFNKKHISLNRPGLDTYLPKGFDSTSISDLYKIGFANTKTAQKIDVITKRQMYRDKYGLMFMSDEEIQGFISDNNFIMGDANKYIGEIPIDAVNTMLANLKKLNDQRAIYTLTLTHDNLSYELFGDELFWGTDNKSTIISWEAHMFDGGILRLVRPSTIEKRKIHISDFWNLRLSKTADERVMVIAGAKEFNTTGLELVNGILSLPVPKDPIAVLRVPNGYVEIANWE